jgi:hypothetical protein
MKNRKKLEALLQSFEKTWPEAKLPMELNAQEQIFFLSWLDKVQKEKSRHGCLLSSQRDGGSPGRFWWLAFMASWRFGFTSHVFCLGRSKDHELIPECPASEYPLVYFLDGVNELWKPRYKEQVSTIINWCEHSEVPLWLEIREAASPRQSTDQVLELKEAFKAYIAKMKSRPILNWLDEDCLSRLIRVCSKGAPAHFLKEHSHVDMDTRIS